MKKLVFIALVATGLRLVPVQRSDAQVTVGVGGVGIGFGYPGYRYGYYPYSSGYYPYGYYRPYPNYSYYSGPSYYNGHRYYRHHRHHHYYVDVGLRNSRAGLQAVASQLFSCRRALFAVAVDAQSRIRSSALSD